ncbi:MAG TPA: hypothetical protein VLB69_01155, partial [Rudaea sp.]|nr:hypothetical protein [Rudaea sp.]
GDPAIVPPDRFEHLFGAADGGLPELAVIVMLGNGFIITSMVWASFVVALIDQRRARAAAILLLGALLTAFGVIHSIEPSGGIYLPWSLAASGRFLVAQFTGAYLVLAAILLALGALKPAARSADEAPRAP